MRTAALNDPDEKPCDGHSVAVIVIDPSKGVLIGDVPDGAGASSVGGHVFDVHWSYKAAACGEVLEETGLTVTALMPVFEKPVRRLNPCKRGDGPYGLGHYWQVYIAEVDGRLNVDPKSLLRPRWVSRVELQRLAQRTLGRAQHTVSAEAWAEEPGITPTWVQWFAEAGLIEMAEADLRDIEQFMRIDGASRR
ncbi:NUDIX domain-containing protein [Actinomadura sp. KC345]|uniref:NUDIX hydrolase n=1 Tax=Actinomadura sp. KC345 TaxID=2530371 RepID=UPI001404C2A7|nr:NUDIX domain-containing protein [Actinomadura sp. KC345]